nr:MAG TPA: hypothetical protein [Caudoviricetes sp.]
MKAKSYKLKYVPTKEQLIEAHFREGGSWINHDAAWYVTKSIDHALSVSICFKNDISDWNDFDNVLVLDEEFGQPYMQFYGKQYKKEVNNFPCIERCVEQYNEFMDSFDFLCEVTDMEDKKYCPLCYGLSDTATSSKTLMCSEEKCMWWQDGDCICNTAVKLLGLLANSRAYLKSAT